MEQPVRELGKGVAGPNRRVYAAGALALTEPGPAAVGVVVTDAQGRMLAHRAHYLGQATRREATTQALLSAARLALSGGLEAPVFCIDDAALAAALDEQAVPPPEDRDGVLRALRETLAQLPGHRIQSIPANSNRARPVALTPLVDWLPERTRRAEGLRVRSLGDGRYEVESESQPDQVYHVTLRPAAAPGAAGEVISCECADFLYRGIPCKHLFAVAREAGALDRLFYAPLTPQPPLPE
jgi:hypothetical protein